MPAKPSCVDLLSVTDFRFLTEADLFRRPVTAVPFPALLDDLAHCFDHLRLAHAAGEGARRALPAINAFVAHAGTAELFRRATLRLTASVPSPSRLWPDVFQGGETRLLEKLHAAFNQPMLPHPPLLNFRPERVRGGNAFGRWFPAVVCNCCADACRELVRHEVKRVRDREWEEALLAGWQSSPEADPIDLSAALAGLDDRARQIVGGVIAGKKQREIAKELGLSDSNVSLRLHRALEEMRRHLEE